MKINTKEDYEAAKKRFAELFHACACATDEEEGNAIYEALEEFEKNNKPI